MIPFVSLGVSDTTTHWATLPLEISATTVLRAMLATSRCCSLPVNSRWHRDSTISTTLPSLTFFTNGARLHPVQIWSVSQFIAVSQITSTLRNKMLTMYIVFLQAPGLCKKSSMGEAHQPTTLRITLIVTNIHLHNTWWIENRKSSKTKWRLQTISQPALRCLQTHHQAAEEQSVKPCVLYHCRTWSYPFGAHWEDQKWPYIWSPCPWRQSEEQSIWKIPSWDSKDLPWE